ncbi:MAG: sulfatase-like hydrolase/transferase [Pirellulaceae bacterium]|nr:sulfatase-like hydrolase/transferase [Pirellulaceae bacterium]
MKVEKYCSLWFLIMTPVTGFFFTESIRANDPNIVLIMADDLGYGDLSCYNGWIKTPHIDSIAKRGVRFTDFHSNGTICSPTRAALMTGRYQQRAGIPSVIAAALNHPAHYRGLQLQETTIAEHFKQQGYACAIFGKWHLGYFPKYNPTHQGFDKFVGYVSGNIDFQSHVDQAGVFDWWHDLQPTKEVGYSTHLITAHAVEFIKANKRRPFFLYVPHEAPHYPYQGPTDPPDRTVDGDFNNRGTRTDTKEAYREMVSEMDKGVGEIVTALSEASILDNTIVIFCSDNGATTLGSNGALRGFKGTNFEGGHRVPCVIQWPGHIDAGNESPQLMASMDFLPSLFGLAGLRLPRRIKLDGMDLSEIILSERDPIIRTMVWNGTTIRRGRWKYMAMQKGLAVESLFDLTAEVDESINLITQYPRIAQSFHNELELWKTDMEKTKTPQPSHPK